MLTRQALNALGSSVKVFTGNQARIGIGITGTWVGTLSFFASYDGVNFTPYPLTVTQWPPATPTPTTQQTTTANGNFAADVGNALAVAVVFTAYTSGTALIAASSANDGSYQDAFLAPTSVNVSQNVGAGAQNLQTIGGQPNRSWRCRSASVSFNTAPANPVEFQILDGASSVLWDGYISGPDAVAPGVFQIALPPPDPTVPGSGGVIGTQGNSMGLKLFAPGGSVISTVNAELHAA